MTHRLCPVPMCGSAVKAGHLMCRDCWSRVPRSLQRNVNSAWRSLRSAAVLTSLRELRGTYEAASKAAIDAAEASRP